MTNKMLAALEPLLGTWDAVLSDTRFLKSPEETVSGEAVLSRELGGAVVVMRVTYKGDRMPAETWVLSVDDDQQAYTAYYHDSRGVARHHKMSFGDGLLELWRQMPGSSQRFAARLDEGQGILNGEWQFSSDGVYWHRDFKVTYTRKG